jgi:hypothetical protein
VQRWQYRVVNIGTFFASGRLVEALGRLGEDGWELVTIYDKSSNWLANMEKGFALFKRPVAHGEEPDGPWAAALNPGRDAEGERRIQRLLDERGIVAPGAVKALGPYATDVLDGVARLGADGNAGVIAVRQDRALVWWADRDAVEQVSLRSISSVERSGTVIRLRADDREPISVLATNDRFADSWVKLMRKFGAKEHAPA